MCVYNQICPTLRGRGIHYAGVADLPLSLSSPFYCYKAPSLSLFKSLLTFIISVMVVT